MTGVWSVRLALHLTVRIAGHHPVEDVRCARLRSEWGPRAPRRMLGFFLMQGLLQAVLSTPFALICANPQPAIGPLYLSGFKLAGASLWAVALAGESVADWQLARFRRRSVNRAAVCQEGLWNYFRHPNYFFEWLVWGAFWLFACGSPTGWITLFCPVLMFHFLRNVTGIPLTEELSVKSRGDAYRAYQRTTSAFFPWFKRPDHTRGSDFRSS